MKKIKKIKEAPHNTSIAIENLFEKNPKMIKIMGKNAANKQKSEIALA